MAKKEPVLKKFKEIFDYFILNKEPLHVCTNYVFNIVVEDKTLFGRSFQYQLNGLVQVLDKELFARPDLWNHPSVNEVLNDFKADLDEGIIIFTAETPFIREYLREVFFPVLSDYVWVIDELHFPHAQPQLYKLNENKKAERVNFYSEEIRRKLKSNEAPVVGGVRVDGITTINFLSTKKDWIYREENMISDKDMAVLKNELAFKKHIEDYCLEYEREILKKINTKTYEFDRFTLQTKQLSNGLLLEWKMKIKDGSLRIYRTEGGFSDSPFDIRSLGIKVVDSRVANDNTLDVLEQEKDYYYTVNWSRDRNKTNSASEDESHYFRFAVHVPNIKAMQDDSEEQEIIAYKKAKELEAKKKLIDEQHKIKIDTEKLFINIEHKREVQKQGKAFLEALLGGRKRDDLNEEESLFYDDLKDKLDFEIKRFKI